MPSRIHVRQEENGSKRELKIDPGVDDDSSCGYGLPHEDNDDNILAKAHAIMTYGH